MPRNSIQPMKPEPAPPAHQRLFHAFFATNTAASEAPSRSADFQVCRIADFQVGRAGELAPPAGLETRDTADLEVCATALASRCPWIHPIFLLCFGFLLRGQAAGLVATWGDGSAGQTLVPAAVGKVRSISAGAAHSLALRTDGTAIAWGQNTYHQTEVPAGLRNVVSISAGAYHCLALTSSGTVGAWGRDTEGQSPAPSGLLPATAVAAGATFSLALQADGTVAAWGNNAFGQTAVPAGLSNVVAIAAGGNHSLALQADGTVVPWSDYLYGETNAPGGLTNLPPGLSNVVAIAAGWAHSLALRDDGTVVAWGANSYGQTSVPVGLSNVTAIAAGGYHSLALRADGTLVAWGRNSSGQASVPTGLAGATAIAAGGSHSLAVIFDGPVQILQGPVSQGVPLSSNAVFSVAASGWEPLSYRWFHGSQTMTDTDRIGGSTNATLTLSNTVLADLGTYHVIVSNAFGSVLSTDATLTVISPPFIASQSPDQTVAAGSDVTLSVSAAGTPPMAYGWYFQGATLAVGTSNSTTLATRLVLTNVQAADAGTYSLWVSNAYGGVRGDIRLTVTNSAPYLRSQPAGLGTVVVGSSGSFAVSARGSLPLSYQWRLNGVDIPGATNAVLNLQSVRVDQTGYYNVVVQNAFGEAISAKAFVSVVQVFVWGNSYVPTNVPAGLTNVIAVSAGADHVLALKADGTVATWISSYYAAKTSLTNVPATVNNVVGIAAGGNHSAALRVNGTVIAWGDNTYGQTNVPVSASNVTAIAAGGANTLALRSNGTVVGWGANNYGQTNVPAGLSNVVAIAAGSYHSVALRRDGRVVGWGGYYRDATNVPAGLSNVIAIAAGYESTLALKADGSLVAWGSYRPTVPSISSNAVSIAAGYSYLLALQSDGGVVESGSQTNALRGLTNVIAIAAASSSDVFAAVIGNGSPVMTIQPVSQTVAQGSSVQFHARAVGVQPMTYQWQLDGQNLPGATNASLALTNVQGKDIGGYRLVASNVLGRAVSSSVTLSIPTAATLAEALNATNLVWTNTVTNALWFAQIHETHDGAAAAQSGPTADGKQSTLQTTVIGPGTLTFWWKVSSELGYDFLKFFVDGNLPRAALSGETDWQRLSFAIPASSHTLQWSYVKDGSVSAGQDAGWLDDVQFTPNPPVLVQQPTNQVAWMGGTVTFQGAASGTPPLSYQWTRAGADLPGATATALTLTNLTRHDSGTYAVRVANGGGSTLSSNATLTVHVPQQLTAPVLQPDGSFAFTSGDADGGRLEPADVTGLEAQASTNLVNWIALPGPFALTNGVLSVRDAEATNQPLRFYRMVER